jgi:hypothetical protein
MVMAYYFKLLGQKQIGDAVYQLIEEEHNCAIEDALVD